MRLNLFSGLKFMLRPFVILSLSNMLLACGGNDTDTTTAPLEQEQLTATLSQVTLNAKDLPITKIKLSPMELGTPIEVGQIGQSSLLNAEGGFTFPQKDGYAFDGNITVAFDVSDEQGIKRVLLGFEGTENVYILCDKECGIEFKALINGISPQLLGWDSGNHTLALYVEDSDENRTPVDFLNLTWHKKSLSGVTAQIDAETGILSVNWNENPDLLRYNVYLATEPGHDGKNINDLEGGEARLSLTQTSATFDNKSEDETYYILVTGTDMTGESAYSDEIILTSVSAPVPPVAINDEFTVNEDTEVTGNLLANDSDPQGAAISINTEPLSLPANGSLTINADGTFSYIPDTDFNGSDQFSYQISNSDSLTSEAVVTIVITPVNDAPVAGDDEFNLVEDTFLTAEESILINDFDNDDDKSTLTLNLVETTENGLLVLELDDGTFTYQPNQNFFGTDSFTYSLTDPEGSVTTAQVTLTITSVNDAPVAGDDLFVFDAGKLEVGAPGLLEHDEDPDNDKLTVALITPPEFGTLQLFNDGAFIYTPGDAFTTFDGFDYQISDGSGLTSEAHVSLRTPDFNGFPPVAADDEFELVEDTVFTTEDSILINDLDRDDGISALSLSLTETTKKGALDLNLDDGHFTYLPNENFFGSDSFSYSLTDPNGNTATAHVRLTISSVNDAPIANDDKYRVGNDQTTSVYSSFSLLRNDSDPEGEKIEVDLDSVTQPSFGSVIVRKNGSFHYTPDSEFEGVDSFTYSVTDQTNLSAAAEVQMEVVSVFAETDDLTDAVLLLTDISSQLPENATLTQVTSTSGTIIFDSEKITYQPTYNFNGIDTLVLSFEGDDEAFDLEVTIRVNRTNLPPVITSEPVINLDENTDAGDVFHTITATDEPDQASHFAISTETSIFSIDKDTGQMSIVDNTALNFEQNPSFELRIRVTDPYFRGTTQVLTIDVNDVNDLPQIGSEPSLNLDEDLANGTLVYTLIATDEDEGDSLTYSIIDTQSTFSIDTITGELRITDTEALDFEQSNNQILNLMVEDARGGSSYLALNISLNDINEAPEIQDSQLLLTPFPESFSPSSDEIIINFTATDPDADDELTWSFSDEVDDNFIIDPNTGDISVVAGAVFDFESFANYSLNVVVSDEAGLTSSAEVEFVLEDVNESPIANNDEASVVNYGEVDIFVLANDSDPENDTLTVTSAVAERGSVSIDSDGTLNYRPNANIDNDRITYTIADEEGLSQSAEVNVTVSPLPLAGEHDLNLDSELDLTASYSEDVDLWQLVLTNKISTLFKIDKDRYYPIEPNALGIFEFELGNDTQPHAFGAVLNGKLHTFELLQLSTAPQLQVDQTGEVLSSDPGTLTLPTAFVDIYPTWNGEHLAAAANINPRFTAGNRIELFGPDGDGIRNGKYQAVDGLQLFTWSPDEASILVTKSDPDSRQEAMHLDQLLELDLIGQDIYDAKVETGTELTFNIDIREPSIRLNINDNQAVYLDVTEVKHIQYSLPAALSEDGEPFTKLLTQTGDSYRLYFESRLSTVPISAFAAGNYYLPKFDLASDESETPVDRTQEANFKEDGSGTFIDFGQAFSWSITEEGHLSIEVDGQLSYQIAFVGTSDIGQQAYVTATDSTDGDRYAVFDYLVQATAVSEAEMTALVNDEFLMSAFTLMDADSYDAAGLLSTDSIFGFALSSATGSELATDEFYAKRYFGFSDAISVNDWTWQRSDNEITLKRYYDITAGFNNCHPTTNASCYAYDIRSWQLLDIDTSRNRIWFLETNQRLDFNNLPASGEAASYIMNISHRVNHYTITPNVQTSEDEIELDEDGSISGINVLENDLDSQSGEFQLKLLSVSAQNGMTGVTADNLLDYAPNPDFSGTDTVSYFVVDGYHGFGYNQLLATVNPVNDAPIANLDTHTLVEGGSEQVFVLLNDLDVDGDNMSIENASDASHGVVSINTDGTLDYAHDGSETLTDSFTYTLSDGEFTAIATVNIIITPINDAPVADAQSITTSEDASIAITLSGTDVDGTIASYTTVTAPTNGTLTGTAPDLTYTPNSDFNGSDSFMFTVTDNDTSVSTAQTVSITVDEVNDAPIADPQSVITNEDVALSITLTGSDVDGTIASFATVTAPTNGTLSGAAPNLTYTPSSDFNGSDSFTFTATDDNASTSATQTISITVNAVNDAPVAVAQSLITNEELALSITLTGSDVDGTISAFTTVTAPTNGTLTGTAPNLIYIPNNDFTGTDGFMFTVTDNDTSVSTAQTVSITVNDVNDSPVADTQSVITNEDVALSITLTGSDVDGAIASFATVTAPTNGTLSGTAPNLTYTPNSDFNGTDGFMFTVTDDDAATSSAQVVSITVDEVNDAPVVTSASGFSLDENLGNGTSTGYTATTETDPEGNNIAWSIASDPHGIFAIDTTSGEVTVADNTNLNKESVASYNISVQATETDGNPSNLSGSHVVTVTINDLDEIPVIQSSSTVSVDEDASNGTNVGYTASGFDPESNPLVWSLSDPLNILSVDGNSGVISVANNAALDHETTASYSATLTADDGGLTTDLTLTVTVNDINEAPSITSGSGASVAENQTSAIDVDATDEDVGDSLSYSLTGSIDDTLFSIDSNSGVVTFVSAPNFESPTDTGADNIYNIEVTATDDGTTNLTAVQTIAVTVTDSNDAPVITSGATANAEENQLTALTPSVTEEDPGDTLTYSISGTDVALLSVNTSTGVVSFNATPNFESPADSGGDNSYEFTLTVIDDGAGTLNDAQAFTVSVTDVVENTELVLDTDFHADGIAQFNTYADTDNAEFVHDAIRDSSGNAYVLLNTQSNTQVVVAKVNSDGSLDATFGHQGRLRLSPTSTQDGNINTLYGNKLVLDTNVASTHFGQLYVVGYQYESNAYNTEQAFVIRLTTSGALDSSFGTNGKYVNTSYMEVEGIDLLLHSDGFLYFASNHLTSSGANTKLFYLEKINASDGTLQNESGNDQTAGYILDQSTGNSFAIGLVENASAELVVLGHRLDAGAYDIIAARLDKTDIPNATILSKETYDVRTVYSADGTSTSDLANAYSQIDGNFVVLGGSSNYSGAAGDAALLIKLKLSDLSLDSGFGSNGIQLIDVDGTSDDSPVVSLDVDGSGNITFATVVPLGGGDFYSVLVSQVNSSGTITTAASNLTSTNVSNPTEANGEVDSTFGSDIEAHILHDASDSNDPIYIFSSQQVNNYVGPPDVSEVETLLVEHDSNGNAVANTSFILDFDPTETLGYDDLIETSDNHLLSLNTVDNEGTSDFGFNVTKHTLSDGSWHPDFANRGFIGEHGNSKAPLDITGEGLHELADGSHLTVTSVNNNGTFDVKLRHYTNAGVEITSGNYPATFGLTANSEVFNTILNTNVGTKGALLVVGRAPNGANHSALAINIDIDSATATYNYNDGNLVNFGTQSGNMNKLGFSDAILNDDGTAILIGYGDYNASNKVDVFAVKLDASGAIDADFDGNNADSSNILPLIVDDAQDVFANNAKALSNGKIIVTANTSLPGSSGLGSSYLLKFFGDGGMPETYQIDTGWDVAVDGVDSDDVIKIDVDGLNQGGSSSTKIWDLAIDGSDNLYFIGSANFAGNTQSFVAKFNGNDGSIDLTFGQNSLPGYFAPYGRASCDPNNNAFAVNICDAQYYDKIIITSDGKVVIGTTGQSHEQFNDGMLLKFTESQDDSATSYTVDSGGA